VEGRRVTNAPGAGYGTAGSALVVLDDQRTALASVLVLQEMGLTVDVAADRDAALAWVRMARYAVIVCGGGTTEQLVEFALKVRAASPATRILMLGNFGPQPALTGIDVHILRPPVNVNALVEQLRPLAA
jgi:DNA-binding response OmpR family regulator